MELFGGLITVSGIPLFLLAVFLVVTVGLLLGRITVKGVSLGHAAVFLVALLFGCLFYTHLEQEMMLSSGEGYLETTLKAIESLGLVLFVTSVGFMAGPRFFGNLRRNFKSYVLIAAVVVLTGGLVAVGCIFFGRHVMGESDHAEFTAMIVGILSGALTSTPAFSAAKASVLPIYESAVVVGHGIAYIFGVVGKVLFVQLVPKLSKVDMAEERERLRLTMTKDVSNASSSETKSGRFKIDGYGIFPFMLAAVIGVFVGMIRIPLSAEGFSGACFSLTVTGGCLLSALVFGHFGRIGSVRVLPEESTLKLFREWGLILFLVGAGIAGGAKFIELFRGIYFVYGIVMTVIPMLVGFFFAKYVLKTCLLNNLGSLTGGMTSTPALGTLISVSGTEEVGAAYAATYPVALILVVLLSEALVLVF